VNGAGAGSTPATCCANWLKSTSFLLIRGALVRPADDGGQSGGRSAGGGGGGSSDDGGAEGVGLAAEAN